MARKVGNLQKIPVPAVAVLVMVMVACLEPAGGFSGEFPAAPTLRPFPSDGDQSGFLTRERIVVKDAEEWSTVWDQLRGSMPWAAPVVDFSTEMVLIATMGSQSTSGFSIHIDQFYEQADTLFIVVREVSPAENCSPPAGATAPFAARKIPSTESVPKYVEQTEEKPC